MIVLDFRSNNRVHGLVEINFQKLEDYVYTLGFLCNLKHYKPSGIIKINVERNQNDNAWDCEKRIYYYGTDEFLQNFLALDSAKSAGVGNVTWRINSKNYINHLINEYNFIHNDDGRYITDIIPSVDKSMIESILRSNLRNLNLDSRIEDDLIKLFELGYNI